MSELELRRLIPLSAAASLVSVGCPGVEVPSAREERAETVTEIAQELCETTRECSPASFDAEFNSIRECTRYYESYIEEYLDYAREEYGRACAEAYLDAFECVAEHTICEYDYYEIEEHCRDDLESLYDECYYY